MGRAEEWPGLGGYFCSHHGSLHCWQCDPRPALLMTNRVRDLRNARNWSQAQLAERLGVSRQTVNAIETERYDPSLPLAFKVADVFKLSIEKIFDPRNNGL